MAKKKKVNIAGILFLVAIAVLVIALVAVIIVLCVTCRGDERESSDVPASGSPDIILPDDPSVSSAQPVTTPDILSGLLGTNDPPTTGGTGLASSDPNTGTASSNPGGITVTTPEPNGGEGDGEGEGGITVYTEPTSEMKRNAEDGHVSKNGVNMRKGPATSYDIVKSDISIGTSVTLYQEQEGWYFLKCGSSYGYIRKDMVEKGEWEDPDKPDDAVDGVVSANSIAALRKEPSREATCIADYEKGTKLYIFYKKKTSDGDWYYVQIVGTDRKGYMFADLVDPAGSVPTKD